MYDIIFSIYVYSFIIFLLEPVFNIFSFNKFISYFYVGVCVLSFIKPIKFKSFKQYIKNNITKNDLYLLLICYFLLIISIIKL